MRKEIYVAHNIIMILLPLTCQQLYMENFNSLQVQIEIYYLIRSNFQKINLIRDIYDFFSSREIKKKVSCILFY